MHDTLMYMYMHDTLMYMYMHDTLMYMYMHDTLMYMYMHDTLMYMYMQFYWQYSVIWITCTCVPHNMGHTNKNMDGVAILKYLHMRNSRPQS